MKRRDRHERGLRGPLVRPGKYARALRVRRRLDPETFFAQAVSASVARVARSCPEALQGVVVGFEDVPGETVGWSSDQVPLAAAIEASGEQPARVVVFRRPLEHRAVSQHGLRILVHRIVVQQLSALTTLPIEAIDPEGFGEDWD